MAAPPPSLERLLTAVGQGDRDAFESLYDEVAGTVYGIARRILVDPARAQEVAQEVLIEVWQKASDYQAHRASALTWIAVMTRRRAIDAVRSTEASRRREDTVLVEERSPADPVGEEVEVADEHRQIADALTALSDAQRQVIDMAFFEGMTHREVSDRLEVPLGTVKTRIRDGLKRLSASLQAGHE